MLIVLGFYKRKLGLTHEEFSMHWRNIHGPLIAQNPMLSKYVKRSVQHHITPSTGLSNVGDLGYDGFSESWFETLESYQEMHSLPDFRQEIVEDEHKFIDRNATRIIMIDNQVVAIGKDYSALWAAGLV